MLFRSGTAESASAAGDEDVRAPAAGARADAHEAGPFRPAAAPSAAPEIPDDIAEGAPVGAGPATPPAAQSGEAEVADRSVARSVAGPGMPSAVEDEDEDEGATGAPVTDAARAEPGDPGDAAVLDDAAETSAAGAAAVDPAGKGTAGPLVAGRPNGRTGERETGVNLFDTPAPIDEATLRALITDVVHRELQGALGDRVSHNIRTLVRREIARALEARDLD